MQRCQRRPFAPPPRATYVCLSPALKGNDWMNRVAVSVIVPTYREAENLPVLVPRVAAALEQAQLPFEIVIVDDNSPDATPQICAELAKRFPVRLEVRAAEPGLSSAVVPGLSL